MKIVTEGDKVQMFRCPVCYGEAVPWRFTSCAAEKHVNTPMGYVKVDPYALVPFLVPIDQAPGYVQKRIAQQRENQS